MIAPRILTAALAATFLSLSGAAMADTNLPPMISVTGEATINAAPDLAQIDGGVTTDAKTAREASDANNATMGRVLLALQGAGIAERTTRPRGCRSRRNTPIPARTGTARRW